MALEGGGVCVERLAFEPELEQMVRRDQAGDDRRRAGSEPPGERDLAPDLEAQAVGGVQALEGTHAEVRPIGGQIGAGLDRELARLGDLQLQRERERGREHVVAGTEVRRGGRDPDEPASCRQALTAT